MANAHKAAEMDPRDIKSPDPTHIAFVPQYIFGSNPFSFSWGVVSGIPANPATWAWLLDRCAQLGSERDCEIAVKTSDAFRGREGKRRFQDAVILGLGWSNTPSASSCAEGESSMSGRGRPSVLGDDARSEDEAEARAYKLHHASDNERRRMGIPTREQESDERLRHKLSSINAARSLRERCAKRRLRLLACKTREELREVVQSLSGVVSRGGDLLFEARQQLASWAREARQKIVSAAIAADRKFKKMIEDARAKERENRARLSANFQSFKMAVKTQASRFSIISPEGVKVVLKNFTTKVKSSFCQRKQNKANSVERTSAEHRDYAIYKKAVTKWSKAGIDQYPDYAKFRQNPPPEVDNIEAFWHWSRSVLGIYKRDAFVCRHKAPPGKEWNILGEYVHKDDGWADYIDEKLTAETPIEALKDPATLAVIATMSLAEFVLMPSLCLAEGLTNPVRRVAGSHIKKLLTATRIPVLADPDMIILPRLLGDRQVTNPGLQPVEITAIVPQRKGKIRLMEICRVKFLLIKKCKDETDCGKIVSWLRNTLAQCGDIEPNPGPSLEEPAGPSTISQTLLGNLYTTVEQVWDETPAPQSENLTSIETSELEATIKAKELDMWALVRGKSFKIRQYAMAIMSLPFKRATLASERLRAWLKLLVEIPEIQSIYEEMVDLAERTRVKVKPAWAPLLPIAKPKPLSYARIRLSKLPGMEGLNMLVRGTYHDALRWQAEHLAPSLGMTPDEVIRKTEIVRMFPDTEIVDQLVENGRIELEAAGLWEEDDRGIDGLLLADEHKVWESMQRYGPRDENVDVTQAEQEELVDAFYWRWPEFYAHAELTPDKKLIKQFKASPGYPLLFIQSKKKLRGMRTPDGRNLLAALIGDAVGTLGEDTIAERLSHVFPKSQVVSAKKLREGKDIRTIIGADWINFIRGRKINGDINDRKGPWDGYGKPGMPMNGSAFNRLYQNAERYRYHYSLDGKAFDSNVREKIFHISTELRRKGYRWHPDYDQISAALTEIEGSVLKGHLVNLAAKIDSEFRHFNKEGGIQTGHESVTEDNTECLEFSLVLTLMRTWTCTAKEVMDLIWIDNVGDDNFLHTLRQIDREQLLKVAEEVTGTIFRFENEEGTEENIEGIVFLSKFGEKLTDDDRAELEAYGIDHSELTYKVKHVADGIVQKYSALRQDGHTRARLRRSFDRYEFLLERINGYVLLTAHRRDLYDFFARQRQEILSAANKVRPGWKARLEAMKKLKFVSYEQVMKLWYAPLPLDESRKGQTTKMMAYVDWLMESGYDTDRLVRRIRGIAMGLDPEFWDLPEVPHYILPSDTTWTPKYQIERFIHLMYLENNWPQLADGTPDFDGSPPSITQSQLLSLVRESPFMGQCDVLGYSDRYAHKVVDDITRGRKGRQAYDHLVSECVKWRFRMTLLSLFYSGLTIAANSLPAGWLALGPLLLDTYNQVIRRLFSWFSYAHWLDQGHGSASISNLVPKDPYGVYKFAAVGLLAMVPEAFSIPDLLPFMNLPRIGPALDNIAGWILRGKGLFSEKINDISDVSTKENILEEHPWAGITRDVLRQLSKSENRSVLLDAPTASGKTYWFPQFTRANFILDTGIAVKLHIILVPTKILRDETKVPNLVYVDRDRPNLPELGVCIMTYGHAKAIQSRLNTLNRDTTLFQLDELHVEAPEIVWMNGWLASARFYRVVSTATPNLTLIQERFERYRANAKGAFPVEEISMPLSKPVNVMHDMLTSKRAKEYGFNKRILLIHPSLTELDKIANSLRKNKSSYGAEFEVNVLHGGRRHVPADGHILATQMVDFGVTIKGITCVIDSGVSITNHKGTVQRTWSSEKTRIQRRGRTGRTDIGVYINCGLGEDSPSGIQLPGLDDAINNLPMWNKYGSYNLISECVATNDPGPSKVMLTRFCRVPQEWSGQTRGDAKVFTSIYTNTTLEQKENRMTKTLRLYESLRTGRADEEVEHLAGKPGESVVSTSGEFLQDAFNRGLMEYNSIHGWIPHPPDYQGSRIGFTGGIDSYIRQKVPCNNSAYKDIFQKDLLEARLPLPNHLRTMEDDLNSDADSESSDAETSSSDPDTAQSRDRASTPQQRLPESIMSDGVKTPLSESSPNDKGKGKSKDVGPDTTTSSGPFVYDGLAVLVNNYVNQEPGPSGKVNLNLTSARILDQ